MMSLSTELSVIIYTEQALAQIPLARLVRSQRFELSDRSSLHLAHSKKVDLSELRTGCGRTT